MLLVFAGDASSGRAYFTLAGFASVAGVGVGGVRERSGIWMTEPVTVALLQQGKCPTSTPLGPLACRTFWGGSSRNGVAALFIDSSMARGFNKSTFSAWTARETQSISGIATSKRGGPLFQELLGSWSWTEGFPQAKPTISDRCLARDASNVFRISRPTRDRSLPGREDMTRSPSREPVGRIAMSRDHSRVLHLKSWGPEGSVKGNAP